MVPEKESPLAVEGWQQAAGTGRDKITFANTMRVNWKWAKLKILKTHPLGASSNKDLPPNLPVTSWNSTPARDQLLRHMSL